MIASLVQLGLGATGNAACVTQASADATPDFVMNASHWHDSDVAGAPGSGRAGFELIYRAAAVTVGCHWRGTVIHWQA